MKIFGYPVVLDDKMEENEIGIVFGDLSSYTYKKPFAKTEKGDTITVREKNGEVKKFIVVDVEYLENNEIKVTVEKCPS